MDKHWSRAPCLEVILQGHLWFWAELFRDGVILNITYNIYLSFLTCVSIYIYLSWIKVCHEHPVLEVMLLGHLWFLTGYLKDWDIFDITNHSYLWFMSCVQIFSSLAWKKVWQEQPVLGVILREFWWFLAKYLVNWVMFYIMDHHNFSFLSGLPIFSSQTWIELCQKHSLTWRTLMVPAWRFGGLPSLEDVDGPWLET